MPVTVRKNKSGGWDIVERATGKIKGHSTTKRKAEISASIRNREYHRKEIKRKISGNQ